jgi:endogenous inhibitor of DNA gyrase (YacG/DUF329 family)
MVARMADGAAAPCPHCGSVNTRSTGTIATLPAYELRVIECPTCETQFTVTVPHRRERGQTPPVRDRDR